MTKKDININYEVKMVQNDIRQLEHLWLFYTLALEETNARLRERKAYLSNIQKTSGTKTGEDQ